MWKISRPPGVVVSMASAGHESFNGRASCRGEGGHHHHWPARASVSASVHDGAWDLTLADRPLVEAKRWANRLRFAVMLLFFRARRRFPRAAAEVDGAAVAELARSLGVPEPSVVEPLLPDAADRTAERQRAEIRALLGFREAGVADAEELVPWLRDHAVARTRNSAELAAEAEARCRALRIEPPTPDRIARVVRAATRAYEDRHVAAVHARLTPAMRVGLDALLQPSGPEAATEAENGTLPDGRLDAPLIHLRAGPGRASVASLREELARLGMVRGIGLPDGLFADWSPAELETSRQRVAVEAPFELRRHPRHAWLAAYVHLRGRAVTDIRAFVRVHHAPPHRAQHAACSSQDRAGMWDWDFAYRTPPIGLGAHAPNVRCRSTHRTTVAGPRLKSLATARRDWPASTAATTRSHRSIE